MKPQSRHPLIVWHKELDSTNNEVRRHLGDLDNMSAVAAMGQTCGRGRGSHRWIAAPGQNLTFSLLLRFGKGGNPELPASDAVRITHFCTLAVCDLLEEQGLKPRIKWPNDIWIEDRKICGILIENVFSGNTVESSIVGIGLNLNQKEFDPALPNPTSLSLETGNEYPLEETMDALYEKICRRAEELSSDDGRARLELEFSKRMFVLDKPSQDRLDTSIEDFEARR